MSKTSFYVLLDDLKWVLLILGTIKVTVELCETADPKKSPYYKEEYSDYVEFFHFKVTTDYPIETDVRTSLLDVNLAHPYPEDMLVLEDALPK